MAETLGNVTEIAVSPDRAKVVVRDQSDGQLEGFWLWERKPTDVAERIIHSMYLSVVGEALRTGKRVRVSHGANSALVTSVAVLGS